MYRATNVYATLGGDALCLVKSSLIALLDNLTYGIGDDFCLSVLILYVPLGQLTIIQSCWNHDLLFSWIEPVLSSG